MAALHGRRIKTKTSGKHRLFLGDADLVIMDDVEKLELLKKVRTGDKDAIEKMILGHVRLVISIVSRYVKMCSYQHYAKDLDCAALLGLVEAVNRISKGSLADHNNVTAYIVLYVHQYISRAINESKVVRTPPKKKDKRTETLYIATKHSFPIRTHERQSLPPIQCPVSDSGQQEIEVWDEILNTAETSIEKQILELGKEGYFGNEINEILGISMTEVYRIRQRLLGRYLAKRREDES